MSKRRRRLWLRVLFRVPPGVSKQEVLETLKRAIENGTYQYPSDWKVVIQWRNKENEPMREGPFTAEMTRSKRGARGGTGFDKAVLAYLERQEI